MRRIGITQTPGNFGEILSAQESELMRFVQSNYFVVAFGRYAERVPECTLQLAVTHIHHFSQIADIQCFMIADNAQRLGKIVDFEGLVANFMQQESVNQAQAFLCCICIDNLIDDFK